MKKSLDIMVDLETLGLQAGCMVIAIGACSLDEEHTFYKKIHKDSCPSLKIDPSTMAWWQKQSMEAQKEAFSGTLPLLQVLGSFSTWWNRLPCDNKNIFIWGNGADFDSPILRAAYQAVNMREPWAPFNSRCYRTLKNLYPQITADAFEGTKHNALHDATFQARHARKILHEHFKAKLPVGS